jgi:hypothetical protein
MEVLSQMTTPIEPVAPAEGTITPEPTSEPVTTPEGEAPEKQPEQPQYVTKEEMDQIMAETIRRVKQSDRDRAKQIDGKLTEIKGMLEKAGTPVTPEQEAALRNQITDQIDVVEQEPQPAGQIAAQPADDPLGAFLAEVFDEAGATVTPNDPEWKEVQEALDANWNNPKGLPKVTIAAAKAAEAKAERTAAMHETAPARVGGGGKQIAGDTVTGSGREMLSQAFSKGS